MKLKINTSNSWDKFLKKLWYCSGIYWRREQRSSCLAFEIFLQQGREGNLAGNSSFLFRGHLYFRRCPSTSSLLPYSMVSESCLRLNHANFIKLKREPASSNCLKCRWETSDPTSRNSWAIFAVLKGSYCLHFQLFLSGHPVNRYFVCPSSFQLCQSPSHSGGTSGLIPCIYVSIHWFWIWCMRT